jgi:hypothetical protein
MVKMSLPTDGSNFLDIYCLAIAPTLTLMADRGTCTYCTPRVDRGLHVHALWSYR